MTPTCSPSPSATTPRHALPKVTAGYFPAQPEYILSKNQFYYPSPNGGGQWIYPLYPKAYSEDISWETTTTWNVGFDFGFLNNRITASADWYLRNTDDLLAYTPCRS